MTSFYEASTSGLNFDRFTDELFGESTKLRMKQAYWTAKQLLRQKMGKREDEHLEAADAALDMQLQRFKRMQENTRRLLDAFSQLHREHVDLAQCEIDFANLLTDDCEEEKEHLKRVLQMTANSQALTAKERQKMLRPILRFYHELDEFYERAILDCEQTVEAVERARLDYRGSLLWMKKCSETLDPERASDSTQLEDFRTVQNVVKANKQRLDRLKADVERKVDLLQRAMKQLLTECVVEYRKGLMHFYQVTAAEFGACAEQMAGLESYEIDVLKILEDPIGVAMEKQREERERRKQNASGGISGTTMGIIDNDGQKRPPAASISSRQQQRRQRQQLFEEREESLIELEDVEEAAEVTEPAMDRVRKLLRFDDDDDTVCDVPETMETAHHDHHHHHQQQLEKGLLLFQDAATSTSHGLNLLKHSNELAELGLLREWNDGRGGGRATNAIGRPSANVDLFCEHKRTNDSAEDLFAHFDSTPTGFESAQRALPDRRLQSESPLGEVFMDAIDVELPLCERGTMQKSPDEAASVFDDIMLTEFGQQQNKMPADEGNKQSHHDFADGKTPRMTDRKCARRQQQQQIVDLGEPAVVPRLPAPPTGQRNTRPVAKQTTTVGTGEVIKQQQRRQ